MTIDLAPFCSKDETKFYLSKPFAYGDKTYATDGHVILELDLSDYPSQIVDFAPNPLRVFDAGVTKEEWDSCIPHIDIELGTPPDLSECKHCSGQTPVHSACPDCMCVCSYCDGTNKSSPRLKGSTNIGVAIFDQYYIRLIQSLPGLRTPPRRKGTEKSPMPFKFEGGRGALMPISHELLNHIRVKR